MAKESEFSVTHYEPPIEPADPAWLSESNLEWCCGQRSPEEKFPYSCTRTPDHYGPHAAHGDSGTMYAAWGLK